MNSERRQRFREFMGRMDPSVDPAMALGQGLYVTPPDAVGARIAADLEISSDSSHLICGGIGSGKTTQLIQVERILNEIGEFFCIRIDVLAEHQYDKLRPGVLTALAAAALLREAESAPIEDEATIKAMRIIRSEAVGEWVDRMDLDEQNDYEPEDYIWVSGILQRPPRTSLVQELSKAAGLLAAALKQKVVVLFDGLDRLRDLEVFASVTIEDIPALRDAGIGTVVIGPQQVRPAQHEHITSAFLNFRLQSAAPFHTAEGRAFLVNVLNARVGSELLSAEMAEKLATWSGGLIRDLIALARGAAEEAYATGYDSIEKIHVDAAADRFGRSLLLAGTSESFARLRDLPPIKSDLPGKTERLLALTSQIDLEMLLHRLIIEIPGTPLRFVPHPTIVPLMRGMRGVG